MTLSEEHRHFPHDRSWSCHVLAVERFIRNIAQPDVDCGGVRREIVSLPPNSALRRRWRASIRITMA